jgi:AmiR/NasT family two-component response regulator
VVVISGSSPKALEEVAHRNVEAKLRKPFDIHELLEAVRRCARLFGG